MNMDSPTQNQLIHNIEGLLFHKSMNSLKPDFIHDHNMLQCQEIVTFMILAHMPKTALAISWQKRLTRSSLSVVGNWSQGFWVTPIGGLKGLTFFSISVFSSMYRSSVRLSSLGRALRLQCTVRQELPGFSQSWGEKFPDGIKRRTQPKAIYRAEHLWWWPWDFRIKKSRGRGGAWGAVDGKPRPWFHPQLQNTE